VNDIKGLAELKPYILVFLILLILTSACRKIDVLHKELLFIEHPIDSIQDKEVLLTNTKTLLKSHTWARIILNVFTSFRFGLRNITIDHPLDNSIYPPDMVPPTIRWHDEDKEVSKWIVKISFAATTDIIYALIKPQPFKIPEFPDDDPVEFKLPDDYLTATRWTPSNELWNTLKSFSPEENITIEFFGVDKPNKHLISRGKFNFKFSKDNVGASLFYRMVSIGKQLGNYISLVIRDLKSPAYKIVIEKPPTCVNCHSFSYDGKYLGMDVDGPLGKDKGTYTVTQIKKRTFITLGSLVTWNTYQKEIGGEHTLGFMAAISPSGKYVVGTVNERIFDINYPNSPFPMGFFPFQGHLAYLDTETKVIKSLPGADQPEFVNASSSWCPNNECLAFSRGKALPINKKTMKVNGYSVKIDPKVAPKFSGDPKEPQLKYDIYKIPFNHGKGGKAVPIVGASNNGMSNSFPKYSHDGKWLVYVQSKNALLMRPDSNLFIIPADGGKARRLNSSNRGPMNSWHSWSPNSRWLVFSSKRNTPYTQLFLTHIDENGIDSPAILIPNSTPFNRA